MNGGSNYIDVDGTLANSPLFGVFHDNRDTVRAQLQTMFDNGQRMIALSVWFCDADPYGHTEDLWAYMFNSHNGDLAAQYKQNIADVLALVQQIGFTQIHFRFDAQLNALPEWPAWDEAQFQQNLSFIMNVIGVVKANVSVKTLFDLAGEFIDSKAFYMQYCTALWREYTARYGSTDATMSINTGHRPSSAKSRAQLIVHAFKGAGLPLPVFYLADCYGNEYLTLKGLHDGMVAVGQGNLPVYLQECFYNDKATATEVKKVRTTIRGLKLKGIFQWPGIRGTALDNVNFGPVFPKDFRNYSVI